MLRSPTLFQPPEELYPGRNSTDLGRPLLINDSLSDLGKLNEALIAYDKKIEKFLAARNDAEITLHNAVTGKEVAWINYEDFGTKNAFLLFQMSVQEYFNAREEIDNLEFSLSNIRGQRIAIQSQLNVLELELVQLNCAEEIAPVQCEENQEQDETSDEDDDEETVQNDISSNGYSRVCS
jgi:hypothetical protein